MVGHRQLALKIGRVKTVGLTKMPIQNNVEVIDAVKALDEWRIVEKPSHPENPFGSVRLVLVKNKSGAGESLTPRRLKMEFGKNWAQAHQVLENRYLSEHANVVSKALQVFKKLRASELGEETFFDTAIRHRAKDFYLWSTTVRNSNTCWCWICQGTGLTSNGLEECDNCDGEGEEISRQRFAFVTTLDFDAVEADEVNSFYLVGINPEDPDGFAWFQRFVDKLTP
jgi:hypothetical protein